MRAVRVYSRPATLANIDQRTREARLLREVRADLTDHVGGCPTATQKLLIDRAAAMTLHVSMLDAKQSSGRVLTDHDARQYLAWSNALSRLMRQLGMRSVTPQRRSLAEHIASHSAAA